MPIKSSEKGDVREEEGGRAEETKKAPSKEPVNGEENLVGLESLGKADMVKMMLELKGEIASLQARETKAVEEADDDEYDLIEDYLETPAVFFCFSDKFNIHADVRKGHESLPPLCFINFMSLYRYNKKHAKGFDVVAVSQRLVISKAQAEWLRDHSYFSIKFFENINEAESVNTMLAEKMASYTSMVSRLSDHAVIQKAQLLKLHIHADVQQLRKEVIQKLAEKDIMDSQQKKEAFFNAERDEMDRIIVDKSEAADSSAKASSEVY